MSVRNQGQHAKPSGTPRRPSARALRRARLRASLVVAVASLCLCAQAAVVAHALLVPHTTCLEHGTVSHDEEHAHATPSHRTPDPAVALAVAPPDVSAPAAQVGAGDAHALEDEHCAVLGTQHTGAQRIFEAGLVELCALTLAPAPIDPPAATSAPAPYRLAPKTSPPLA